MNASTNPELIRAHDDFYKRLQDILPNLVGRPVHLERNPHDNLCDCCAQIGVGVRCIVRANGPTRSHPETLWWIQRSTGRPEYTTNPELLVPEIVALLLQEGKVG